MGTKKTTPRADSATVDERVQVVYKLILQQYRSDEIVNFCERTWGVARTQTHAYIARARAQIAETAKQERGEVFNERVAELRELRKTAYGNKDYWLIRALLKDEIELFGLNNYDLLKRVEALESLAATSDVGAPHSPTDNDSPA